MLKSAYFVVISLHLGYWGGGFAIGQLFSNFTRRPSYKQLGVKFETFYDTGGINDT